MHRPFGELNGLVRHSYRAARGRNHGSKTKPHRVAKGSRCRHTKLTEFEVREIFKSYHENQVSHWDLGIKFSINPYHVLRIAQGKTWTHLNLIS